MWYKNTFDLKYVVSRRKHFQIHDTFLTNLLLKTLNGLIIKSYTNNSIKYIKIAYKYAKAIAYRLKYLFKGRSSSDIEYESLAEVSK